VSWGLGYSQCEESQTNFLQTVLYHTQSVVIGTWPGYKTGVKHLSSPWEGWARRMWANWAVEVSGGEPVGMGIGLRQGW
jgi:hypothetical protein